MSQSESRRVAHCMYVEIELKKNFFLILKVWFYENSVKLRQSPTHATVPWPPEQTCWRQYVAQSPHGLTFTQQGSFLDQACPLLSLPSLSVLLPTGIFHLCLFSPTNFSRHICSFLARTVLSVYTGLSPIFLFCTSLLFATSLFLTHFQSLEVGRCLPSGRGENRASTHYDKHGWRSEEIVKKSGIALFNAIIIIITR